MRDIEAIDTELRLLAAVRARILVKYIAQARECLESYLQQADDRSRRV